MAQRLRRETAVTLKWIATQLHWEPWTHGANRLQNAKNGKQTDQDELELE